MIGKKTCIHLEAIKELKLPEKLICGECVKTGSSWVHLMTCQPCGATLCCDSSPNRHMTKHFHHTRHPVIISDMPGEKWMWCYEDQIYFPWQ